MAANQLSHEDSMAKRKRSTSAGDATDQITAEESAAQKHDEDKVLEAAKAIVQKRESSGGASITIKRNPPSDVHQGSYSLRVINSKSGSSHPMLATVNGACDEGEAIRMFAHRIGVEPRLMTCRVNKA